LREGPAVRIPFPPPESLDPGGEPSLIAGELYDLDDGTLTAALKARRSL
jgi:hypothetical protein